MNNNLHPKKNNRKLFIKNDYCKGCGICVEFCPSKILYMYEDRVHVQEKEKCTKCGLCELRCPDYAIFLEEE